ncbi:MAG: endonuclease VIII [Sedimenticolaceae bacterium]
MPEGPEMRRAADKLARAVIPLVVSEVFFAFDNLKPYAPTLTGRRIEAVETRGKALLIHFDNDISIFTHNQLYGRWIIRQTHRYPVTNRQLRLAIHNEKRSALLYSASEIEVLTPQQLDAHPFLATLGPDVLAIKPRGVLEQLAASEHLRRRLGSLLLDQRFLAGIGNYLRSEILFVAGLHPRLRPVDCSADALERLARAAVAVSRQSYRHNGITNDLERARQLRAQGQPRSRYRHWVFARGNRPCRLCGASIVQDVAAGRRIYFCPTCQPERS